MLLLKRATIKEVSSEIKNYYLFIIIY